MPLSSSMEVRSSVRKKGWRDISRLDFRHAMGVQPTRAEPSV